MKIGVVADTHSKPLPKQMLADFKSVDLIIHAGDFCDIADYQALAKIKEVEGVYGNMDNSEIRKIFPRRQILKFGSFSVGLFHGEGPPKTILEKVKEEFQKDKVDIVIFGHSHQPLNEKDGEVLYFNPGSPNDTIFAPYCSYGIIDINEKNFSAKHIKVKDA
jgi:putative phosphoesterase